MIESEETTQNISSTIFKPKQTFNETSYTEIYNNDKQNKKNNFINNYIDQDSSNLPIKTMLNKRSSTFSDVLSNKQIQKLLIRKYFFCKYVGCMYENIFQNLFPVLMPTI